jgi:hypothetical protein
MGFRFRKTIKLFPGVKLNLSKSGISTSIGGRGATINVGKHGTKATIGIPGTGISYTENLSKHANTVAPSEQQQPEPNGQSGNQPEPRSGIGVLLMWVFLGLFAFLVVYGLLKP